MTSKKKKVFILVGMVALLVLTGVLNIVLNNVVDVDGTDTSTTYSDFFVSFKVERETWREQSILYYDAIIASSQSSKDAKDNAEAARQALIDASETERTLEGLIKGLGFADAIVTSTTQNINVIVKCTEMTGTQANQILDIIVSETGALATNVRVIPTE